jgi:hypothetical protein
MEYCDIRAASAHVCPIINENFKIPFGRQEKKRSRRRLVSPKVTSKFQKLLFLSLRGERTFKISPSVQPG